MDANEIALLADLDGATVQWEYMRFTLLTLCLRARTLNGNHHIILLDRTLYIDLPEQMHNTSIGPASSEDIERVRQILSNAYFHYFKRDPSAITRELLTFTCDEGRFHVWAQKLTVFPLYDDFQTMLKEELDRLVDIAWPSDFDPFSVWNP